MAWLEAHPEKDVIVAAIGIAFALAIAVYAAFKPYPADFDAAGNLLVDGAKMAKDTYRAVDWVSAFFLGWVLERRFVRFSTDGVPMERRATRVVFGVLSYYVVYLILNPMVRGLIAGPAGVIAGCFIEMFNTIFVVPFFIKLNEGRVTEETAAER